MSTGLAQKRFSYRFFTDKWMFVVVLWFYFVITYQLLPNIITDVYLPFILCFVKFAWTKSSYIQFNNDSFLYCHKELPTYLKKQLNAKSIVRVYLKVLFFTTIDKQYCLIEYQGEEQKIKNLLLNLERFTHPEMVKLSIISFCKKNNIEIIY
jgi:hypothetical protein